jgi:peroxiredoxin
MLTKLKSMPWRSWAKEALITALICGAVYLVIRHFQHEAQKGGGGNLPVGKVAASFELREVRDGKAVSLSSLQGRPVILNFWATWCPTCVDELPTLDTLNRESDGRYYVYTISSEHPLKLREYMQDEELNVPVLFDRNGLISNAYKVNKIPTTVIIDAQGKLVHDFAGAPDLDIMRDHMDRLTASSGG